MGVVLLCGCNSFFSNSYGFDIITEKKMQSSRKSEIIRDNRVEITTIITHLNEISPITYNNREYFFVEVYGEEPSNYEGMIDYMLNGEKPLWIREVQSDEFDEILSPSNRWSKCYLLAFRAVGKLASRDLLLDMKVIGLGDMSFDFGFKTLPMQF